MKFSVIAFILLSGSLSWAQLEIHIRPESFVNGDKITIGDIADFKNFPTDRKKQISNIEISDAPSSGEVRKFTNFGISEILRYNMPELSNIRVSIPQVVAVRQRYFSLKKESVEKNISAWIESSCAPCAVKISNLQLPNVSGVGGKATWDLVKNGNPPKGAFYLPIVVNDAAPRHLWVRGEARIFKQVPVLKRMITVGVRIQKEDYSIENRDVTFSTDTIASETDLIASDITRTINANEIIWKSLLKRRLVMQRGQPVNVVMKSDGWNVNIQGIAQSFGYIGDMIRVLNPATNKYLVGVVVDQGTIEVK